MARIPPRPPRAIASRLISLRQTFCRLYSTAPSTTATAAFSSITSRILPVSYDYLTPQASYLLTRTLSPLLPDSHPLQHISRRPLPHTTSHPPPLPAGHHLVYFPPALTLSELLDDGTDPAHSPGPPFTRRMWAGGSIDFRAERVELDGRRAVCAERIADVKVKEGPSGLSTDSKVFVTIERHITPCSPGEETLSETEWRNILFNGTRRPAEIVERRELVFMPEDPSRRTSGPRRVVKAPHTPTLSHTLRPSQALLFRYSALTFNAHSIHLDTAFCRDVEGHRDLLVHGPLSLTLALALLAGRGAGGRVRKIEYRNLAPLYANESMTVCARPTGDDRGEEGWEVWIEGPDGGMCFRGRATSS